MSIFGMFFILSVANPVPEGTYTMIDCPSNPGSKFLIYCSIQGWDLSRSSGDCPAHRRYRFDVQADSPVQCEHILPFVQTHEYSAVDCTVEENDGIYSFLLEYSGQGFLDINHVLDYMKQTTGTDVQLVSDIIDTVVFGHLVSPSRSPAERPTTAPKITVDKKSDLFASSNSDIHFDFSSFF